MKLIEGSAVERYPRVRTEQDTPRPQAIFQLINSYQSSAALKRAPELGLFTAISTGTKSANELAQALAASERGVLILFDFLVITGLLEKEEMISRCSPKGLSFWMRIRPPTWAP